MIEHPHDFGAFDFPDLPRTKLRINEPLKHSVTLGGVAEFFTFALEIRLAFGLHAILIFGICSPALSFRFSVFYSALSKRIVTLSNPTKDRLGFLARFAQLERGFDRHAAAALSGTVLTNKTLVTGSGHLQTEARQIVVPIDRALGVGEGGGAGNKGGRKFCAHHVFSRLINASLRLVNASLG